MARPPLPIEDRRDVHIHVRATVAEALQFERDAAACGISIPELLRRGGLKKRLLPKRTDLDLYALSLLHGLANNANQIAHHANAGRPLPPDAVLAELKCGVLAAIDRLHGSRDQ